MLAVLLFGRRGIDNRTFVAASLIAVGCGYAVGMAAVTTYLARYSVLGDLFALMALLMLISRWVGGDTTTVARTVGAGQT
jgi:hypothetical protein